MMRTKKWISLFTAVTLVMIMTGSVFAEGGVKININTASVIELVELQNVGPSYAQKIVAYRQQNGPFNTPEDIMLVTGIGQRTFEVNKDRIVVK
jgi:competence protein ComEA